MSRYYRGAVRIYKASNLGDLSSKDYYHTHECLWNQYELVLWCVFKYIQTRQVQALLSTRYAVHLLWWQTATLAFYRPQTVRTLWTYCNRHCPKDACDGLHHATELPIPDRERMEWLQLFTTLHVFSLKWACACSEEGLRYYLFKRNHSTD